MSASADKTLAVTADKSRLRHHDFATVVPRTKWLNDEIVNGLLLWLDHAINLASGITDIQTETRKILVQNSFFFQHIRDRGVRNTQRALGRKGVRKANFLDIDSIIMPVCENKHWTLIVVRPQKRTMSHMDSLTDCANEKYISLIIAWIKDVLEEKFDKNE